MATVLVIDDDAAVREMMLLHLRAEGHDSLAAETLAEAEQRTPEAAPDLVILDVRLPDGNGIDFIPRLRELDPEVPIIVVTAHHEMESAIRAMRAGATDYLMKPVSIDELQRSLERGLAERRAHADRAVITLGQGAFAAEQLVGKSAIIVELEKELGRYAAKKTSVLLCGESGTGKELAARILHRYSDSQGPFVGINCAAVVPTLMESELFGHEKGAFTGATHTKAGKLELARDGTVFLDEIGDLPLDLQAKLLRVLQEREFEHVGGVASLPLRARIVAATNRDLDVEVKQGRFREDLFHRLSVVTLRLPPLRERVEDIQPLVEYLLGKINRHLDAHVTGVDEAVIELLKRQPWPGNIRELENALIRACVQAGAARVLVPEHFTGLFGPGMNSAGAGAQRDDVVPLARVEGAAEGADHNGTLAQAEHKAIVRALRLTGGHKGRACALLGISRPTMDRKLRKFGIRVEDIRH